MVKYSLFSFRILFQKDDRIRFLFWGGFNTIVGYLTSLICYYSLYNYFHIVVISIFASIISMSFSFYTQKKFVFYVTGSWIKQYIKNIASYSVNIGISSLLIWLLVDYFKWPFWLAQALLVPLIVIFSYYMQKYFTFN